MFKWITRFWKKEPPVIVHDPAHDLNLMFEAFRIAMLQFSDTKGADPMIKHITASLCEEANKDPSIWVECIDGLDRPWQRIKHKYPFNPQLESDLK